MRKIIYLIIAMVGVIGLLSVLAVSCLKSVISTGEWFVLLLSAAISMAVIGIGLFGYENEHLL